MWKRYRRSQNSLKFNEALEAAAEKLELQLRPLDKKQEKVRCRHTDTLSDATQTLLSTHRATLLSQLDTEQNPATCLHLVVVLLFMKKRNALVHIPGRSVSSVLGQLKVNGRDRRDASDVPQEELPPPVYNQLNTYQSCVVKFLNADKQVKRGGVRSGSDHTPRLWTKRRRPS